MTFREDMAEATDDIFDGLGDKASYSDASVSVEGILVILRKGMQEVGEVSRGVGPLDYVSIKSKDVQSPKRGGLIVFENPSLGTYKLLERSEKSDFYQRWKVEEQA